MLMRIKGVHTVRSKGRIYHYHRKSGVRLKSEPGSSAFIEEIERLESETPIAATLGSLIEAYRASTAFAALAPRTRADYEKVFSWFSNRAKPIRSIDGPAVARARDKALSMKGRRFANYVVQVLSLLFTWGNEYGHCKGNPALRIKRIRRPRTLPRANRPWTDEERSVVFGHAEGSLKIAIALGMFAGLSEGDVIHWPWTGYTGKRIVGTRRKNGGPINVLAHPQLRAVLKGLTRHDGAIVQSRHRRPYTESGLRTMFFRLIRRLEQEGAIAPGLTFHGLRHTVGKILGEAWANERAIARAIGDSTDAMGRHYSAEANIQDQVDQAFRRAERRMNVKPGCKTPPKKAS